MNSKNRMPWKKWPYIVYDSEKSNQMEPKEAYWLIGSGPGSDCKEAWENWRGHRKVYYLAGAIVALKNHWSEHVERAILYVINFSSNALAINIDNSLVTLIKQNIERKRRILNSNRNTIKESLVVERIKGHYKWLPINSTSQTNWGEYLF